MKFFNKISIFKAVALGLVSMSVTSCDYLDFDETNSIYTQEDMYRYFYKTSQMLTNVYRYIPQDTGSGALHDCACDDAEYGNTAHHIQTMNNGTWSAINTVDTKFDLYNGIRCANEFIKSVKDVDFSRFENESGYENQMKQLAYYEYEARILRCHFFFELARRYGDIAMPLEMLTTSSANTIKKTPFADVIKFIVEECDACAPKLPLDFNEVPGKEWGRITRGYAMALKTKALLYAASPLHNPSKDVEAWKKTAAAAKAVMDLNFYSLDPGDKVNSTSSKEIILTHMNPASQNFERENFPIRFTEGKRSGAGGNYPTQNLVDAFQTKNGYDVTLTTEGWRSDDPDFDPKNPYDNRDPRFAKTILANGMEFKESRIETFVGGKDYADSRDLGATPTGYFLRKYVVESTSFVPEAEVSNKHHWVIYRYAETLLTYAEAMFEAFGDPNYTDAEFPLSALAALNQVRANSSMPAVNPSADQFTDALRREWRVEFAFEDHRFWDVRRWMIGAQTQKQIYGVRIEREGKDLKYTLTTCVNREWDEKMNLYPIPQGELFANPNLNPQNKGW